MTVLSWSLVMVPASTSGSSAVLNMELMSGACPPGPSVAAVCVVLADPDELPHAASRSPPVVAAARITTATTTATIGLRISHLLLCRLQLAQTSVPSASGPSLGDP